MLAGTQRSDKNVARDVYRHPGAVLSFFGLRDNMTVVEIWPGSGGWWTEILAGYLAEHGRYYAALADDASSEGSRKENAAFKAKLAGDPAIYGKVVTTTLKGDDAEIAPPGSVDLVLTFRNLHDWLKQGTAEGDIRAFYRALKPGGTLGMVDHRADPAAPVDPQAKNGYVNEAFAIALVEKAGFKLAGRSEVNDNPKDTKDYPEGVWTLPPTLRLKDQDRAKYLAIGESDRFTLKFVKPGS
jgi:predicted methyltransferase